MTKWQPSVRACTLRSCAFSLRLSDGSSKYLHFLLGKSSKVRRNAKFPPTSHNFKIRVPNYVWHQLISSHQVVTKLWKWGQIWKSLFLSLVFAFGEIKASNEAGRRRNLCRRLCSIKICTCSGVSVFGAVKIRLFLHTRFWHDWSNNCTEWANKVPNVC